METCGNYLIDPKPRIGRGGFGFVEKIDLYNHSMHFCGEYARKNFEPDPELLAQGITEEELKRRFKREIIYQANICHSNVVAIYMFDDTVVQPYFVMEIAEKDLFKILETETMPLEEKYFLVECLLQGMHEIHSRGLIHRDIKPQNILRFHDGVYKISDFGLIKDIEGNSSSTVLTAIGQCMGSRRYMAPEILIDCDYCIESDIYAVGRVLEDLGFKNDKSMAPIVERCVKYDKSQRYRSISDLIDAVNITTMDKTG
ncbi:hypothetical protein BCT41_06945 [Vibrio splendidus]|uniref:serine/threonine-protein kinase n=2 Tax=Vibrio TaxID=662 RepID=UPI000C82F5FE|nr:serine/threonine-protein kinase [Vibrio splendidus]PMN06239.1 hypothetical protein BCT41_06945 [Vibrio splendidus]